MVFPRKDPVFKRLLEALGVGGPSVDTVLDTQCARPGDVLTGEVRIQGGGTGARIDAVVLSLTTRVKLEHDDREMYGTVEFLRVEAAQA
jgi:sporulation-control protein